MKKLLSVALGLFAVIFAASAQNTLETLKAHPELLTGTDYVCPMDKLDGTPAPEGYKPFYISHYGRHGARYAYQPINYDLIGNALAKAEKNDNLTEFGKDFKARFDSLYPQVEHRAGDLSRVGWQQQQDLSALTYAMYPEVFPDGAHIRACSSPTLRSVMTMSSYCIGIQRQNPALIVTESVADVNLPAVLPLDSRNPFPDDSYKRTPVPFKETKEHYAARNLDSHAVLCRLFKDPKGVVKRSGEYELAAYLYFFASGMNSIDTDLDFMDLFTFDDKLAVWRIDNFEFYTGAWRHHLGYKPVVDDIKAKANECIAAGGHGANLRFAHDYTFLALLMCLDVDGYGREAASPEEIEEICQSYRVPMGANLYFVLYRKDGSDDILFKVLLNGEAAHLPLPDSLWPYYHWADFCK